MKVVVGYMCAVDFNCELGHAAGGNTVYGSVADLKSHKKCWAQCGIVEVKVEFSKEIEPQDFTSVKRINME